jgi:hypothetical protein
VLRDKVEGWWWWTVVSAEERAPRESEPTEKREHRESLVHSRVSRVVQGQQGAKSPFSKSKDPLLKIVNLEEGGKGGDEMEVDCGEWCEMRAA